jgi:glycosyltransferase involved in cell wall biosynthesis
MPKVIHVVRKFEPAEWGGTETHLVHLVRELSRLGWTSEVHAPREAGTDGTALIGAGASFFTYRARYPFVSTRRGSRAALVASGGNLFSFEELMRLLASRRAAVLHTHAIGRLGGIVRVASRARHVPYAVTLHGPVRANAEMVRRDAERRTRQLMDLGAPLGWAVGARRVVHDADLLFLLNPQEQRAWAPDRQGRHMDVIPHGVDTTAARPEARAEARARIPGLGKAPFVLVLGRLDATKGQDLGVEAFVKVAPAGTHLLLVGSTADPAFAETLRQQVSAAGPNVHLVGGVAPSVARALLAEAQLALIPSRAESFGLVLLEAWAEATPALFSPASGLQSIATCTGAFDGMVDSLEPQAWADRLSAALHDELFLARERREGPRRVAAHYTWQAAAERVAAAYRTVSLGAASP